jgi:hypothetical protein
MGLGAAHPVFQYCDRVATVCLDSLSLFCCCVWPSAILCVFAKVMARCSPLDKVVAGMTEVGNMDEVVVAGELERVFGENPTASDGERRPVSPDAEDILSKGGSGNENLRTYYFGSSTITVSKIKEMVEKGYFLKGGAHTPGAETVPGSENNEVVVYDDFFVTGLCMPPHPALADILLHFQVQLHQLLPNAIAQLSKKFWVVGTFRGVPLGNVFVKRYGLHYQPKTVETLEGDQIA